MTSLSIISLSFPIYLRKFKYLKQVEKWRIVSYIFLMCVMVKIFLRMEDQNLCYRAIGVQITYWWLFPKLRRNFEWILSINFLTLVYNLPHLVPAWPMHNIVELLSSNLKKSGREINILLLFPHILIEPH